MTCGLLQTPVDAMYGHLSISWAVLRPNTELCSYSHAVGCINLLIIIYINCFQLKINQYFTPMLV